MKVSLARQVVAAIVVVLALVLVPATLAGKGGNGGKPSGGSLTLVMVTDQNANGLPNWGDRVTFNVSTTETEPYVYLACSQGDTEVSTGSAGFYAGYLWPWQQTFTLSSDVWTDGAADCIARLYYFDGRRTRDLASLSFHVGT